MKLRHFYLLAVLSITSYTSLANNVTVTNVGISGQNNALDFKLIDFDISWENAWYINGGPNNWDAAWVFVKYRLKTENTWHHATLHYVDGTGAADGHTEPANCNISSSNDNGAGGAHGVFIHRTDLGQGTVNFTGVKLRWDYGVDGLGDGDNVELCVIAIEMVYVPQGSFYVGSGGTEPGAFYTYPTVTNPYQINSESAITVDTMAGNLYYSDSTNNSGDQLGPIPAGFPKGYNDFYCMKYEITQSQYVDFLNKLTYVQQVTRTGVAPNSPAGTAAMTTYWPLSRNGIDIMTPGVSDHTPAVYACNLDDDTNYNELVDGQSIACNWLSSRDLGAYLDWAALRPMTELEYEKAGRGKKAPVPSEYAWGNTFITGPTILNNPGENNEVAQPSANCNGNGSITGPMRSGNFAQVATTRVQAGASYYGILELSGNLWERPVTVGYVVTRSFNGTNGNGVLGITGNADQSTWPNVLGFRGGSYYDFPSNSLRLAHRGTAAYWSEEREPHWGGRGCRLAP